MLKNILFIVVLTLTVVVLGNVAARALPSRHHPTAITTTTQVASFWSNLKDLYDWWVTPRPTKWVNAPVA